MPSWIDFFEMSIDMIPSWGFCLGFYGDDLPGAESMTIWPRPMTWGPVLGRDSDLCRNAGPFLPAAIGTVRGCQAVNPMWPCGKYCHVIDAAIAVDHTSLLAMAESLERTGLVHSMRTT